MDKLFCVIDVESMGLYGEGFQVGYTLVNRERERLEEGLIFTEMEYAQGLNRDFTWVSENVKSKICADESTIDIYKLSSISKVRDLFWEKWLKFKKHGAYIAADCIFPVESNFLISCVNQNTYQRAWDAPYPFIEISTLILACGQEPTATYDRLEDEKPQHNALADARQSARIMLDCFDKLKLFL